MFSVFYSYNLTIIHRNLAQLPGNVFYLYFFARNIARLAAVKLLSNDPPDRKLTLSRWPNLTYKHHQEHTRIRDGRTLRCLQHPNRVEIGQGR